VLLAGHSLGEYTALVCADALSFADGLKLVATRGQLMQDAVPTGTGAMAAILGLELQQLQDICANVGLDQVSPANLNAPGQIVIAGIKVAVEQAIVQAKALGAKRAIMLPVSVPSHCALMRPAAEKLAATLDAIQWRSPRIAVVQNFDVQAHTEGKQICSALQQQLFSPVRWIETIEYFVQQGVTEIVECGPGKVLTGLNKRIAPEITSRAIAENIGAGVC
jgi:[acyl-carrier-protein] S-malonyltransferase